MKALILATTLAALSFTANAEGKPSEKLTLCKELSTLAERYMTLRQSGTSMADIYGTANGSELLELMIVQAYEKPQFGTEKYKLEQVSKFKNEWFLSCIKSK